MSRPMHEGPDGLVHVHAGHRDKVLGWLSRGDHVAAFQNVDLGSRDLGRMVLVPVSPALGATLTLGSTRAPDGPHGLGWRYTLAEVIGSAQRIRWTP